MSAKLRGIRGAVTVDENTPEAILEGTARLLKEMLAQNPVEVDEIATIFFSVTRDLDQEFPAKAARKIGLSFTPLLCMNEIPVPTDLERCIRILILHNTDTPQQDIRHVYLGETQKLRPDLNSQSQ